MIWNKIKYISFEEDFTSVSASTENKLNDKSQVIACILLNQFYIFLNNATSPSVKYPRRPLKACKCINHSLLAAEWIGLPNNSGSFPFNISCQFFAKITMNYDKFSNERRTAMKDFIPGTVTRVSLQGRQWIGYIQDEMVHLSN